MNQSALAPTSDAHVGHVIDRGALPVAEVVDRVRRVQQVMDSLMKDGTHYGRIPGTPKPTLYQPGAELLCMTFRVAPRPTVEDLSTDDAIRYRVTMQAYSQVTGEFLGDGVGECSSNEEKYRWRRPVCDQEFAEAPDTLKRERWASGKNGPYKAKQIRTSPADIANTVLKMAYKRALISMARTVLACSDIFAQDLEDLPPEIRESVTEGEAESKPAIKPPQSKSAAASPAPAPEPPADKFPRVAKVEPLPYKKSDGKEGLYYRVTFSDGKTASTFDEKLAKAAMDFGEQSAPVEALIEESKSRPGVFNLKELAKAHVDDRQ